jgi:SAM-dependent methyltransferase
MFRKHWFGAALLLTVIVSTAALSWADATEKKDVEKDVPYVPTPQNVVDKMLEVAKVTKDDVVYDLGCGDGRIVCTAAKKFKCKAYGFDIDPVRIKESEANKAKLDKDIQKLVTFEKKNIFDLDLSGVTVVTLYLLPDVNVRLIPQLKKLKEGSRIVSHDFDIRGVTADKGFPIKIKSPGDSFKEDHEIYKWTVPLKFEKE